MSGKARSRWDLRYELRHPVAPALRREIRRRVLEVADALATLIDPASAFWTSEQGLTLRAEGWVVDFRVDLDRGRVTVTSVVEAAEGGAR